MVAKRKPFTLAVGINGNLTVGNLRLMEMELATCIDSPHRKLESEGPVTHGTVLTGLRYFADPKDLFGFKGWVIPDLWHHMNTARKKSKRNG